MIGKQPVFEFEPMEAIDVHNNASSHMNVTKSGQLISIGTSDGCVKLINTTNHRTIYSSKGKHNLPVSCSTIIGINDLTSPQQLQEPDYLISGSPDYKYNIIKFSPGGGVMDTIKDSSMWIMGLLLQVIVFYVLMMIAMDYIDFKQFLGK